MSVKTVGACEKLCGPCPRNQFEPVAIDATIEDVVATLPTSDARDWMDEVDFMNPDSYKGDFESIGRELDIPADQAASLVVCAVMRVRGSCTSVQSE